jgi:hypothetical protein
MMDNEAELAEIMDGFDICPFCWRPWE